LYNIDMGWVLRNVPTSHVYTLRRYGDMKNVLKHWPTSMLSHVYVQGKEHISGYDNGGRAERSQPSAPHNAVKYYRNQKESSLLTYQMNSSSLLTFNTLPSLGKLRTWKK
jgi:beta-galactosidase GanA